MNDIHSEVVLSLSRVTKTWPDKAEPALAGVDLSIHRGRVLGLLGPNGAGKTTLLSVLMGLCSADSGEIRLQDQPLDHRRRALRRMAGLVPQHIALYPSLSGRENLWLFAGLLWRQRERRQAMVDRCAAIADLGENLDRRVAHYSGGQQRRLNLAVGLLGDPAILFLDEPTVGIDPQSRRFILDSIRQLREEQGLTVVYTTHYMEEVESLCDDVAIIDRGRILLHDSLAGALNQARSREQLSVRLAEPASQALVDTLSAHTRRLQRDGERALSLSLSPETASLGRVLSLIEDSPNRVEQLRHGASLESLFLSLTGRALRD